MQFTWDERKNRVNRRKHGVSFEVALRVFDDPFQLSIPDREVDGELRWQTMGMVGNVCILLVAHTVNEEEQIIRIISARKAIRRERRIYAQTE